MYNATQNPKLGGKETEIFVLVMEKNWKESTNESSWKLKIKTNEKTNKKDETNWRSLKTGEMNQYAIYSLDD